MQEFLQLLAWRWAVPVTASLLHIVRAFAVGGRQPDPRLACPARRRALAKVLLHQGAGAAGLYGVTTRPEARGLGMAVGLYEGLGFARTGSSGYSRRRGRCISEAARPEGPTIQGDRAVAP